MLARLTRAQKFHNNVKLMYVRRMYTHRTEGSLYAGNDRSQQPCLLQHGLRNLIPKISQKTNPELHQTLLLSWLQEGNHLYEGIACTYATSRFFLHVLLAKLHLEASSQKLLGCLAGECSNEHVLLMASHRSDIDNSNKYNA